MKYQFEKYKNYMIRKIDNDYLDFEHNISQYKSCHLILENNQVIDYSGCYELEQDIIDYINNHSQYEFSDNLEEYRKEYI